MSWARGSPVMGCRRTTLTHQSTMHTNLNTTMHTNPLCTPTSTPLCTPTHYAHSTPTSAYGHTKQWSSSTPVNYAKQCARQYVGNTNPQLQTNLCQVLGTPSSGVRAHQAPKAHQATGAHQAHQAPRAHQAPEAYQAPKAHQASKAHQAPGAHQPSN